MNQTLRKHLDRLRAADRAARHDDDRSLTEMPPRPIDWNGHCPEDDGSPLVLVPGAVHQPGE